MDEDEILKRLETLNAIGADLSSERDIGNLLERILIAAQGFADADGATLYRVKGDTLVFEVLRNDSLGSFMGGAHGQPINFPPLPLYKPDGSGNHAMVVAHCALTGQTVNVPDALKIGSVGRPLPGNAGVPRRRPGSMSSASASRAFALPGRKGFCCDWCGAHAVSVTNWKLAAMRPFAAGKRWS